MTPSWYRTELGRVERQRDEWQATAAQLQQENAELRKRLDTFSKLYTDRLQDFAAIAKADGRPSMSEELRNIARELERVDL